MSREPRSRWAGLVLALALAACAPRARPAPELHRAVPAEVARAAPATVRLEGAALYAEVRGALWSAAPPRVDARFRVWVGDVELAPEATRQLDPEHLEVALPPGLPLGVHAVRVQTPAGQEAALAGALAVVEQVVSSVAVEDAPEGLGAPVGERQLRLGSGPLALHAIRRSAAGRFLGGVEARWSLSAPVGTLVAAADGRSATLTPTAVGVARVVATPLDGAPPGATGDLHVVGGVAAVAFVTPAQTVAAGACSPPLVLERRDETGAPLVLDTATSLALTASPAASVAFFLDAACSAPATSASVPPGASRVSVHVRGTTAGTFTLEAAAPAAQVAAQALTVVAGAATAFVWSPIAPQRTGVPFAVQVQAVDAAGNPAEYAGSATLALRGEGTVRCASACADPQTTAAFVGGRWSGQVVVSGVPGGGRALVADGGGASGASTPFDLVPLRSAPRVTVRALKGVLREQDVATLEVRASDYQSPAAELQYSWDFEGKAATPPPWTPWSSSPTGTFQFPTQGWSTVRVAVRDPDGDIGYGATTVLVLRAADAPCIVGDVGPTVDDGATDCVTQLGPDGRLSLAEAVRLANAASGPRAGIAFSPGLRLAGPAAFTITRQVWLVGDGDVRLDGISFTAAAGATLVLSGLTLSSPGAPPTSVQASGFAALENVHVTGSQPVSSAGTLWVLRSRLDGCAAACVDLQGAAELSASASTVASAPVGVDVRGCAAGRVVLTGMVLEQLGTGLRIASTCTSAAANNLTFHGNGVGLELSGGSGHVLRNAAFTGNGTAAVCGTATFQAGSELLLWGNTADGCAPVSATTARVDPLYLAPGWGDFRLTAGSPAIDAGGDAGVDCNDAAPGNFTGVAPDLGGQETY